MTSTVSISPILEPTVYEVVWGCDERARTARVDYHDGSAISAGAEMRATKVFLDMGREGARPGFYVDGVLTAGVDHSCADCAPPVEHVTRTYQRRVGERYVTKSNGSCKTIPGELAFLRECAIFDPIVAANQMYSPNQVRQLLQLGALSRTDDPELFWVGDITDDMIETARAGGGSARR